MTITQLAAIVGAVTGPIGVVLALLVYRRDRGDLAVDLRWDVLVLDDPRYDPHRFWGIVRVANIGRRPVFVTRAQLELSKSAGGSVIVLPEGIAAKKFHEGDEPAKIILDQSGFIKEFASDWHSIRAVAIDSTGRRYTSLWSTNKPSWAEGVEVSDLALYWNRARNWMRRQWPWSVGIIQGPFEA